MPTELRYILFKETELVQALLHHLRRGNQPLPVGQFRSVVIDGGDDPTVAMEVFDDRRNVTQKLNFERDDIASALVTYCMSNGIPLPRMASKAVQVLHGQIAMVVKKALVARRVA